MEARWVEWWERVAVVDFALLSGADNGSIRSKNRASIDRSFTVTGE
jgi:hypothetical protein